MKVVLKNSGSTNLGESSEYDIKSIADYLSENDSGRPDDGYYLTKIEAKINYVKESIVACYSSGTFMGFECDLTEVISTLES